MDKRHIIRLLLALAWVLVVSGFLDAVPAAGNEALIPQTASVDAAEVEAFLDEWVSARMAATPLYSLGFVMVKDGEVFLVKGYGGDPLTGVPFDARTTTVRVASVAKLFTATAAMQLYDQGLIDLDDDVNQYLDAFQVDDNFPQPVTFHHLLTHTEGFERWFLGVRPNDPDSLISLEEFYTTRRAQRILPPGLYVTYDNYASGLLGYLVEEVSGQSFTDYMAEHIFSPLDMDSSTFIQPPPANIRQRLAVEYEFDEETGTYEVAPERLSHLAPAGGMHASLVDMSHFLVAMLGDGSYQGGRILSQETVQMMYLQRFTADYRIPGMTYGFLEDFPNGLRALRRDGDSMNAWSRLYLIPEERIGLFITAIGDEESRVALSNAFFDRFYPRSGLLPQASPSADLARYKGVFHPVADTKSTFGKTIAMFAGSVRVTPETDGTLAVEAMGVGDFAGGFDYPTHWVEVERNLFQRSDGRGFVAFAEDEQGQITHMFSGQRYMGNYRKVAWYELPSFHFALVGLFVVVTLSAFIVWGVVPLVRILRRRPAHHDIPLWASWALGIYGTLSALFCVLWLPGIYLIGMRSGEPAPAYGVNTLTKFILALPLVTTPLTLVLVYLVWRAWTKDGWSKGGRVYLTLVTVAAIGLAIWTNYWNLLGFRF